METVRVQTDSTERIEALALDGSLDPVTGVTDLLVSIRRVSDGYFYDFNDDTFKNTGWTTRREAMTQVSATNSPGEYYYDFDMSDITNQTADDTYMVRIDQSPGTSVANVPQTGEIKEGQYVDELDAAVSSRAVAGDAMDLVADAVDSGSVATSGANEIRDAILSDSTPFDGADIGAILTDTAAMQPLIDAAISTRAEPGDAMTLTSAAVLSLVDDVWDEDLVAAHGTSDTAGLLLRALGALVSQRANNPNLNALLGVIDAAGRDLSEQVDIELTATHGAGSWTGGAGLTQQQVRDAMKLAPTGGAPIAGSVDDHLDDILADTAVIEPLVSTNLDATISSIASSISALNDISIADVQTALTSQGYTSARAIFLDNLDAAISSLNDLSIADVQTAMTSQGYTAARSVALDNLDGTISAILSAIAALNDLSQVDVQSAMTSQGYTTARGALLDNLDAAVSGVPSAVDTVLSAAHGSGAWAAADVSALALEANVEGHVTNSLNTYDPPTRTEATADKAEIIVEVNANETKIDAVQADLDNPDQFKADVSALAIEANVEGHSASALIAYDPPTRTEATADKDEIITEVNANETKIDAIDTLLTSVDGKVDTIDAEISRILGLSHENSFMDNTSYDVSTQLVSARIRLFDSKTNCDAATDGGSETTGLIATYQLSSVWESFNQVQTFKQTKE